MQLLDREFEIFIEQQNILKRTAELGKKISQDYKNKDLILVSILNGSFMFTSDLLKELSIPCQLSFIKVASYEGTESTGQVKKIFGLEENIEGKNIILIDDIVDTGRTIDEVMRNLYKLKPLSIEIASLLLKPESLQKAIEVKYAGFSIPNSFVVGYGLDYNGFGRNLKDIYRVI